MAQQQPYWSRLSLPAQGTMAHGQPRVGYHPGATGRAIKAVQAFFTDTLK